MTPSLQLRSIHLRVSDLARSVDFYARQLGFVVIDQTAGRTDLTIAPDSPPLLTLTATPGAPPSPPEAAGLFHAALLLPDRAALGRWLRHAAGEGVNFQGFSDHGVSEAVYLADPDGNGLEFYSDRPPADWPRNARGELEMVTEPLDVQGLLDAAPDSTEPPLAGARWGHFHFRVTNLDRSEKFYSDALGVTLTQRYGTSARFLAADGYHHHIGLNTWGQPRLLRATGACGIVETVFARAGGSGQSQLDPDGIALRILPAG